MIEIAFDQRDVRRVHRNLMFTQGWHLMSAMAAASDDATAEAKETLADNLESKINLPRDEFLGRIESTEPVAMTRTRVEANVKVTAKRIPIKRFSPAQTSGGVVYNPYVSGRAKVLRHAFGPNIGRLGGHVYQREGRQRLPIAMVPGMNLQRDRQAKAAIQQTQEQVPGILRRHLAKHVRALVDQQFGFRRDYQGINRGVSAASEPKVGRFGKAVTS